MAPPQARSLVLMFVNLFASLTCWWLVRVDVSADESAVHVRICVENAYVAFENFV